MRSGSLGERLEGGAGERETERAKEGVWWGRGGRNGWVGGMVCWTRRVGCGGGVGGGGGLGGWKGVGGCAWLFGVEGGWVGDVKCEMVALRGDGFRNVRQGGSTTSCRDLIRLFRPCFRDYLQPAHKPARVLPSYPYSYPSAINSASSNPLTQE